MSSLLPPLQPLEVTVKIQPNAECITPLELGNITYQYPTQLTTDKISEIVLLDTPVGYSRFAATYGGEPSVSAGRSIRTFANNGFADGGSITYQTNIPTSSFVDDPDDQLFDFTKSNSSLGTTNASAQQKLYSLTGMDTPRWNRRGSSAYFPQLDFFPRYNQWFASTTWMTPFDPQELLTPEYYNVLFVYVDRITKVVYHRTGRARFVRELAYNPTFNPVLQLLSASISVTEAADSDRSSISDFTSVLTLTGSSTAGTAEAPGLATYRVLSSYYAGGVDPAYPGELLQQNTAQGLFGTQLSVPSILAYNGVYSPFGYFPQKAPFVRVEATWVTQEGDTQTLISDIKVAELSVTWGPLGQPSWW